LAATAALRAGGGLATIASSSTALRHEVIEHRPELMLAPWDAGDTPVDRADVLVVGPGLTDAAVASRLTPLFVDDPRPAVWDASALEHVPFQGSDAARIVTPHPGEAARMLDRLEPNAHWDGARVQANRVAAARQLAAATGAIVVLKGEGSIVAQPGGDVHIAVVGSSALATAGSGDVLAGVVGALLGRGCSPCDAAVAGVHIHGIAGDVAARRSPTPLALEIADAVGVAMAHCEAASSPAQWPVFRHA
jgi:NAD(P)H-hydrate epimerase